MAPGEICSVMLLLRWIVPERYRPAGMVTVPPPCFAAASTADWIAAVSLTIPSPFAPKSRMLNATAVCAARAVAGREQTSRIAGISVRMLGIDLFKNLLQNRMRLSRLRSDASHASALQASDG